MNYSQNPQGFIYSSNNVDPQWSNQQSRNIGYGYGYPNQYDSSKGNYNQYSQANYAENAHSPYYQEPYRSRESNTTHHKQRG